MTKIGKSLKIGDIFEVKLENGTKGYLQYIANDITQLNSDVIRVFRTRCSKEYLPNIEEILKDEVDFYSHVVDVKVGEKDGSWTKVGNSEDVGDLKKPLFRDSYDMGVITASSENQVSKKWYVWRIGEETKDVRSNSSLIPRADIGIVTWPERVVIRMNTGKYHGFYPNYK